MKSRSRIVSSQRVVSFYPLSLSLRFSTPRGDRLFLEERFKTFERGIELVGHVPLARRILSVKKSVISLLPVVIRGPG